MSNSVKNTQTNFDLAVFGLLLDRAADAGLQAQLIEALRDLLVAGPGYSGTRLPASRLLAQELSVSRTTVIGAYDQLISEGYLWTRPGGGTFVADHLPHLSRPTTTGTTPPPQPQAWLPFHPGIPDQALFPHQTWSRHIERAWTRPDAALLGRPDPFGWYPLREAISAHLLAWRKLECRPEQIVITAGASEAFDILFRGVLAPDRTAAIEDPGWPMMRDNLAATDTRVQPIRIDEHGLDADRITRDASVAIVTPSRHYPTGISMPVSRRMALLAWANQRDALVVEDDYDSEFRYQGQPLPSLSGLDGLRRSAYLGSFSKLLSPALRIGYLVLPDALLPPARSYVTRVGPRASLIPQPALATFMASGAFAMHLRRMRRTYARRQSHLVSELACCADLLEISPDPSGMHINASLRPQLSQRLTDTGIAKAGLDRHLHLRALSPHCVLPDPPQGLILGYAAFSEKTLTLSADRLNLLLWELSGA